MSPLPAALHQAVRRESKVVRAAWLRGYRKGRADERALWVGLGALGGRPPAVAPCTSGSRASAAHEDEDEKEEVIHGGPD